MDPASFWSRWQQSELVFRNLTPNQGIDSHSIRKAGLALAPFNKKAQLRWVRNILGLPASSKRKYVAQCTDFQLGKSPSPSLPIPLPTTLEVPSTPEPDGFTSALGPTVMPVSANDDLCPATWSKDMRGRTL